MNSNEFQACEDEIKSLEEEIKMLTEEYEHSQHQSMTYTEAEIMEIMKLLRRKPEEELKQSKSSPDQETQLHLLEADLSFIMKFTGIFFTHYSRKLVEKNGSKTIQTYKLSGKCQSISFQLEFKLTEESQMNRNASAIVTDLNIITECDTHCDLSKLVSSFTTLLIVNRSKDQGSCHCHFLWNRDHGFHLALHENLLLLHILLESEIFGTQMDFSNIWYISETSIFHILDFVVSQPQPSDIAKTPQYIYIETEVTRSNLLQKKKIFLTPHRFKEKKKLTATIQYN
ncbi:hypothetical protein L345_05093, partial [Ophiophagus hannah]